MAMSDLPGARTPRAQPATHLRTDGAPASDKPLCLRRPKSTEEIVIETAHGDTVRVHAFLAAGQPVVLIQTSDGDSRVRSSLAGEDMIAMHAKERTRAALNRHKRDRHQRMWAEKQKD